MQNRVITRSRLIGAWRRLACPIKVLPSPVSEAIAGTPPHNNVVVCRWWRTANARRPTAVFWKPLVRAVERNATKSRVRAINTRVGAIVTCQRGVTDSDVSLAGCVVPERIGTNGRVKTASGVVPHRCSANSGEMTAGGVHKGHSKTNGQVEVGVVLAERLRPNGHVKVASGVVGKRPRTNRHVVKTVSIVSKRIKTHGGIVDPTAGLTLSSALTPSAVFPPAPHALGHCALSDGESANQQSAIASVKKPQRNGERLMDLIRVFIFFVHLVGICPVEGVNCPPVRAKPRIIRRNAIPKKRFLIHLAESRLQLFTIARSADPASIILQTTTSVWPKMRWNVAGRDRNFCVSNRASRCQAQYFSNFERGVLINSGPRMRSGLRPAIAAYGRCCYLLSLKKH